MFHGHKTKAYESVKAFEAGWIETLIGRACKIKLAARVSLPIEHTLSCLPHVSMHAIPPPYYSRTTRDSDQTKDSSVKAAALHLLSATAWTK
eukprot:scaffold10314_cov59-Cylindrotheca_fusiformis.AAC.1